MIEFNKNNIGILGGTFDPPHRGHLKISKISIKKFNLDLLIWAITKKNPFKKKSFFSIKNRIEKSKKKTKKITKIQSKYYDQIINSSNTIDLIKYLKKKNKKSSLYLIIGSDNLIDFHKWKSCKLLVKMTNIIVFSRNGYDALARKSAIFKMVEKKKIILVNNKKINVSSSKIRKSYTL